jgi:hypothetical protein
MKITVLVVGLGFLLPGLGIAQDGAGESVAPGVKFEFGTTLNSVLSDTVDARKSKPGDAVKARTSEDVKAGGMVVIPRGAKLIGHVTEAQPAARAGEQARLGIVFERADLKDGRQVPLHTAFYALAAPAGAPSGRDSSLGGFGGGFGGGSAAVGNMVSASSTIPSDDSSALGTGGNRHEELKPSPGAIGGLNSSGTLYASSRGVFGLEDLSLEPNTVPSNGSSVILANARTVRLTAGTRMLLSVGN